MLWWKERNLTSCCLSSPPDKSGFLSQIEYTLSLQLMPSPGSSISANGCAKASWVGGHDSLLVFLSPPVRYSSNTSLPCCPVYSFLSIPPAAIQLCRHSAQSLWDFSRAYRNIWDLKRNWLKKKIPQNQNKLFTKTLTAYQLYCVYIISKFMRKEQAICTS